MKKIAFFTTLLFVLVGCSSIKNIPQRTKKDNKKAEKVVKNALKFKGIPYKFGGTTRRGMDCSGVVYTAFGKEKIQLPRISRDMANEGKEIPLNNVQKGDLLFFKTSKSRRSINHVGLVVSSKKDNVQFIHATTSKGVIISSISENYWKNSFVKAITLF